MKFRGRMPFDEGVLLRGWYNTLSLRSITAEQRADTAEQELAKVRQRAEKLAALLRSQGIQPPKNDQ
jgi:hypothetical protein